MAVKHIVVSGKVQGVGFRRFVQKRACQNAVTGWVRNLVDGRVEILASAEDEGLERLLEWVRRGPPGSVVDDVEVQRCGVVSEAGVNDFLVKEDGESLYEKKCN